MKKRLTFMTLLLVVLSNILTPFQLVLATTNSNLVRIQELNDEPGSRASFKIQLQNKTDLDRLEVTLPEEARYDSLTSDSHNQFDQWDYDEERNTVKTEITMESEDMFLSIDNLFKEENTLIVQAYKKEVLVETFEYQFIKDIPETQLEQDETVDLVDSVDSTNNSEISLPILNETAPELQRDLTIKGLHKKVEAGNDALFSINLKTTGSQVKYNNAKIEIELPKAELFEFEQNLEELEIDGVIPTHDMARGILVYNFDTLKSGQTFERILKIKTLNGIIPNGRELEVKARLFLKESNDEITQEDSSIQNVNASNSIAITKSAVTSKSMPTLGGKVVWKIKVSIPKTDIGQMYLKPGADIIITDIMPNSLNFNKMADDNAKPMIVGKTLTWTFKAPTLEEQEKAENELFSKELLLETSIVNNNSSLGSLKNKATVNTTFIDEQKLEPIPNSIAEIYVGTSIPSNGEIEGNIVFPVHYGPKDNKGKDTGDNNKKNPVPRSYDDGYLQFSHAIWTNYYGVYHDLKSFNVHYEIDDNLILDKLKTPGGETLNAHWAYARTNQEARERIPLPVRPKYNIELDYYRSDGKKMTKTIKDPEQGVYLTRNDLNLEDDYRVVEVRYVFHGRIPAGMMVRANYNPAYFFKIKKGFVGTVENKLNFTGESTYQMVNKGDVMSSKPSNYNKAKYVKFNVRNSRPDFFSNSDEKDIAGPRQAIIEKKPTGNLPLAEIKVSLLDHKSSVVEQGNNRVKINYINNSSSKVSIQSKLESSVLLPPGVTIKQSPKDSYTDNNGSASKGKIKVIQDNYNNSGRQLVRITWDEENIRIGNNVTAEFDVNISANSPKSLYFDVYGFSGNKDIAVPSISNVGLTNTVLQTNNSDDLNGDGKKDSVRIKSSNLYTLIGVYDLQAEKFVRSSTTDEWGSLKKVTPGKEFSYKLHMTNTTNKDISNMTLIDVLPSVGDLGITDNISRGSKFTPSLKGPISLPKEWAGKVNVFYSTATNPKRDDLIRNTKYPEGTTKLSNPSGATDPNWMSESKVIDWSSIHSFKVELLPGTTWIKGVDMDITYDMLAPQVEDIEDMSIFDGLEDVTKRAAYNSFAIATDSGQPVEPFQVGVYMDLDGSLSITKIDSQKTATGDVKKLSGAEFELYNDKDQLITTLITDTEGVATIKGLPLGEYTLKETKAPEGYNVLKKPISVSITNKESQVELTIKNTKQGWHLPNTGGIGTALFYGVGLAMMGIGGYLVLQKKRNKKLDMSEQ